MPRADFVCAPSLRVRWAEVDMQKIVFNGHYLRKATPEYLGSARYDDVLTVCCRVGKLGRSSHATMKAAPLPEELKERIGRYARLAPQA